MTRLTEVFLIKEAAGRGAFTIELLENDKAVESHDVPNIKALLQLLPQILQSSPGMSVKITGK